MLTVKQLIEEVKKISNEYSIQGDIVPDSNLNNTDIFDYRVNDFINITLSKIFREYLSSDLKSIPLYPIKSLIDNKIIQHLNDDIIFDFDNVPKSITFKISSNAVIRIEKIGNESKELIEEIKVYKESNIKRKIKLENDEKLRIVFSGKYPYLIKDFGVYDIEYESESDIPDNTEYTEIELPNDILRINAIKFENSRGFNMDFSDYQISANKLLISKRYKGVLKLIYYRLPNKLPDKMSNLDMIIDCPDACENCLIYYVASMCMKNYDNQLSTLLYNEAELRLSEVSKYTHNHNTTRRISDCRGW